MTTAPKTTMQISANLKVDDRKVLVRSTDTESHAAYCVDQWIALLTVDFTANAPDIDIDDVGRRIEMNVPDALQQHCARHHLALVADQVFEHLKFPRQQFDLLAAALDRSRYQVELEIGDAQHRLLDDGRAAPRQCLDPRQQF